MKNPAPLAAQHSVAFARRQVDFYRGGGPNRIGLSEATRLGLLEAWETQLAHCETQLDA